MSRHRHLPQLRRRRFPRVSGDEPTAELTEGNTAWFSPRERG